MGGKNKMRNKLIGFFVCTLLIATVIPVMGMSYNIENSEKKDSIFNEKQNGITIVKNSDAVEVVDQEQNKSCGIGLYVFGELGWKLGQSFTPTLNSLTKIELKLFKRGEPRGLTISIRSNISGEDLTSMYVSADKLPRSQEWYEFDLPDIELTPGQTYYILWDPDGENDGTDNICWCFEGNNPYEQGCAGVDKNGVWWPLNEWHEHLYLDFCFKTYGLDEPPNAPHIVGPTRGKAGKETTYTFQTVDPEGHDVYYNISWGDGNNDFVGPYQSGKEITVNHTWTEKGNYTIRVQAVDTYGAESEWSELSITMPRNKVLPVNFLRQSKFIFSILQHVLSWLK